MTSETLQNALEQNRQNIKALLNALDADYDLPEDPMKQADFASIFHPGGPEAEKDVEMAEEERAAWLFEENAKALAAAAEAAGARDVKSADVDESDEMRTIKDALGGW